MLALAPRLVACLLPAFLFLLCLTCLDSYKLVRLKDLVVIIAPVAGRAPRQEVRHMPGCANEALGRWAEAAKQYEAVLENPRLAALGGPLPAAMPAAGAN